MISIRSRAISWILTFTLVFSTLFGNAAFAFAESTVEPADVTPIAQEEATYNVDLMVDGETYGTAELSYVDENGNDVIVTAEELAAAAKDDNVPDGINLQENTEVVLTMIPAEYGQIDDYSVKTAESGEDVDMTTPEWNADKTEATAKFTVGKEDVIVNVVYAEAPVVDEEAANASGVKAANASGVKAGKADVAVMAVEDGWYWSGTTLYVEAGKSIDLYAVLTDDNGINLDPKAHAKDGFFDSAYNATIKYGSEVPTLGWETAGKTAGTGLIEEGSYVAAATNGNKIVSSSGRWSSAVPFTVKHYYVVETAVAAGSPEGAAISIDAANGIVIKGQTTKISVADVPGYTATVTDGTGVAITDLDAYAPTSSTTLTVTYTSNEATKYNVTVEEVNGEWGSAELKSAEDLTEGDNALIKVTPNVNTSNAVYWIESVKVGNTALETNENGYYVYTMGAADATITVTYGAKVLAGNTSASIGFNFGKSASKQMDTLEQSIFEAVIKNSDSVNVGTLEADDFTYEFESVGTLTGNKNWEALDYSGENIVIIGRYPAFGEGGEGDTENVRLTWTDGTTTLSITATVTLNESRSAAPINYTKPAVVEFDSAEEIDAAVLAAVEKSGLGAVTVTRVTETLPEAGNTATLTYNVAVAENENYLANSEEVTIDVKARSNPAVVTIDAGENGNVKVGSLEASGTLTTGAYDIVVTPEKGYYVETITINGTDFGAADLVNYSNCVFKKSADIANDNTYVIKATFAKRELVLKDEFGTISMNGAIDASDQAAAIKESVLNAMVGDVNADDYIVSVYQGGLWGLGAGFVDIESTGALTKPAVNGALKVGAAELQITLKGDARYPAVTATGNGTNNGVEVKIEENRPFAPLNDVTLPAMSFTSETEITEVVAAAAAGEAVNPNGFEVTYAKEEGTVVPSNGGESGVVTYVVSFAGNDTYKATTCKITVPVTRNAYQCTITADENAFTGGTIEIVKSETDKVALGAGETVSVDGLSEVTVKVSPKEDKCAVTEISVYKTVEEELVKVETSAIVFDDKRSGSISFTAEGAVAAVNYVVSVSYAEPFFAINEEASIPFRYGADTVTEETEKAVFEAAVIEEESLPQNFENGTFTVEYLAREAGKVDVTIPAIEIAGIVISPERVVTIDLPERWASLDEEITEVTIDDLIGDYKNAALINDYGCHEFGEFGPEKIRISYSDNQYKIDRTAATINLEDIRHETAVDINDTVTVVYGAYDLEDVAAGMVDGRYGIVSEGTKVDAELSFEDNVENLNAGTYDIDVFFEGNDEFKPCSGSFTLEVEKAPASVTVNSGSYRYGEIPELTVSVDPEDVKVITMAAGLNVSEVYGTELVPPATDIYVNVPGELIEYLEGEYSLNDFKAALETISGTVGELLGFDTEVINSIISFLDQIPIAEGSDVKIILNKGLPTDIGVYVVGAVTYDENYETAANVGYMVIHPDGKKAELGWEVEDTNGLVTLPHILNGEYSLAAEVKSVAEGTVEDAAKKLMYLYLGVDQNGEMIIERTNDANFINTYGAYTQLAYIEDFGNEMYYAEPIIRAFAVVPELATVEFEGGEQQQFVFNGQQQGMTATAVDMAGEALDPAYLTYRYLGVDANDVNVYDSTEAPVNVGAYTVIATYADEVTGQYGMAVGAMTITPAPATIEVADRTVVYKDFDNTDGVTTAGSVDGDECKYISVIAGLGVDGNFMNEGIGEADVAANIDFPEKIDTVLKGIVPEAYDKGVSITEFIKAVDKATGILGEMGIDEESLAIIEDYLNQLPNNGKVTFKNFEDLEFNGTGLYVIGAVTCDPNYQVAADYGVLALTPATQKVELAFKVNDDNNIITNSLIREGIYDMGSYVVPGGEVSTEMALEADKDLVNLYISIDKEGKLVKSTEASAKTGLYTQISYLAMNDDVQYYAEPITRTYLVVGDTVTVRFEDDVVTKDVHYKGTPQGMTAKAYSATESELDAEKIRYRYIGYDANGFEIYNDTEAPVNVGTYTVIAAYIDETNEMFGMNVGYINIVPADSDIAVDDYSGPYSETFAFADLIKTTASDLVTTGDTPAYIAIVSGIEGKGQLSIDKADFVDGVVLVDFPDRLDTYLQKVIPAAYGEEGIDLISLEGKEDKIKEALEKLGLEASIVDNIMAELEAAAEAGDIIVRFGEIEKTAAANIGVYALTAIVCDPNFVPAADAGLITIYPETVEAEVVYNQEMPEDGILKLGEVETFDFGVKAVTVEDGTEIGAEWITTMFIGTTKDGTPYMSAEAPAEPGTYKQITTAAVDLANTTYVIESVERSFEIIGHEYEAVVTAPTCTEEGYTTYTCTECGDSYKADYVAAKGHAYDEEWTTDADNHWHECDCGAIKDKAVHEFGKGRLSEDRRQVLYTCGICDYVKAKDRLLWGDANTDNTVDAIDAMLVLRLSVGLIAEEDVDIFVLDVNGDGNIDSIDAMLILRHSVNLVEFFPVEEEELKDIEIIRSLNS